MNALRMIGLYYH